MVSHLARFPPTILSRASVLWALEHRGCVGTWIRNSDSSILILLTCCEIPDLGYSLQEPISSFVHGSGWVFGERGLFTSMILSLHWQKRNRKWDWERWWERGKPAQNLSSFSGLGLMNTEMNSKSSHSRATCGPVREAVKKTGNSPGTCNEHSVLNARAGRAQVVGPVHLTQGKGEPRCCQNLWWPHPCSGFLQILGAAVPGGGGGDRHRPFPSLYCVNLHPLLSKRHPSCDKMP